MSGPERGGAQALHSMQKQFLTMINMYKKSAAKDKKCPLCKVLFATRSCRRGRWYAMQCAVLSASMPDRRGYDTHDDLTEFLHSLVSCLRLCYAMSGTGIGASDVRDWHSAPGASDVRD
eukprot:3511720-Rhodomonas_salina.2